MKLELDNRIVMWYNIIIKKEGSWEPREKGNDMKYTVTEEREIVTFDELSQSRQDKVAQEALQWDFQYDMDYYMEDMVEPHFTTDVQVQYDFSHTQGSGLNLYGEFLLNELLEYACGYQYDQLDGITYKMEPNHRYTYCTWGSRMEMEAIQDLILESELEISEEDALDIADHICGAMEGLCERLYDMGDKQQEWYWNPERYEEDLFYTNGEFFGKTWNFKIEGDRIEFLSA